MERWWSRAYSLRQIRTFQAMPLRDKLLDLSLVLSPVAASWSAWAYRADDLFSNFLLFKIWIGFAAFSWLEWIHRNLGYLTGLFALRSGCKPEAPGRQPDLRRERRDVQITGYFALGIGTLYATLTLTPYLQWHPVTTLKPEFWVPVMVLVMMFFAQLSRYTRHRYWNLPFD